MAAHKDCRRREIPLRRSKRATGRDGGHAPPLVPGSLDLCLPHVHYSPTSTLPYPLHALPTCCQVQTPPRASPFFCFLMKYSSLHSRTETGLQTDMQLDKFPAWLNSVVSGLLLLFICSQGEIPVVGDKDWGLICKLQQ